MAKKQGEAVETPAERQPLIRALVNREMTTAEAFVSIYTNDTQVQISPWDFRFMFGVIDQAPSEENQKIVIKQIAEVRMSPQHAKQVAIVLLQQLQNYEEQVGPIPLPKSPDRGTAES